MTRTTLIVALAGTAALALPAAAHEDHDHGEDRAEARQLGAHEHGVGSLNIALEGATLMMELEAPGADIVGFEHAAESEADKAAMQAAMDQLGAPTDLFVLPAAAGCTVAEAEVEVLGAGAHGMEEAHGHGDEHGHEEAQAEAEHGHAHDDGESHSEFHATYRMDCAEPGMIDRIEFAYFDAFPNAQELEVQLVTDAGATGAEVTREAPRLDLAGAM